MQVYLKSLFLVMAFLAIFSFPLAAENKRDIPLDMFLIIDVSESMANPKNEVFSWVNERLVDQILLDGDRITVWAAGNRAEIAYSGVISGEISKNELRESLENIEINGSAADFEGALRDLRTRISGVSQDRLPYSVLISSSAEGLEPVLTGNIRSMLRWSRSERYERWQVLVFAPDIAPQVQQAAAELMEALGGR